LIWILILSDCSLRVVALAGQTSDNRAALMVAPIGPLATVSRESRQARKGATVVVILCAEVWLVGVTAIYTPL
jgi:hypothetical protein